MDLYDQRGIISVTSRENWRRIQRDDPTLAHLQVHFARDYPSNGRIIEDAEIEELGRDIGNNTHLQDLTVTYDVLIENNIEVARRRFRLLFDGICQNRSIEELVLSLPHQIGLALFQSLHPFVENNPNLKLIEFYHTCVIDRDGMRSLVAPLIRRGSPLAKLWLESSQIDNDSVEVLATAFQEHPSLTPKELNLCDNNIGHDGCVCMIALLQDPRCTLEELDIDYNNIGNAAGIMLANALVRNTTLKELHLSGSGKSVLRAFSRLICNTATINTTYSSNHVLQVLRYSDNTLSFFAEDSDEDVNDVYVYLDWNTNENKKLVARRKVFKEHFVDNFSMQPFEDMEPELLVRVLAFIDKASVENDEQVDDNVRNLIIAQLVKMNPMVCDIVRPVRNDNANARKRSLEK